MLEIQVSQAKAEEAAGDAPILRPIFEPGDALFFDELFLHQTASDPSMPNPALRDRELVLRQLVVPRRLRTGRRLVTRSLPDVDPYEHDPARWGTSLAHTAELSLPCLDAAGARSVVEIGAYAGDFTRVLVAWAAGSGARVSAIDPAPQPDLVALARRASGARADPRDEPGGAAARSRCPTRW